MRRGGGGWGSVSPEPPCAAFRSHARRCQGRAWPARGGCSPIHFPDVERVQWANKIISQTWPYLSMIMENKVREKLEPKIQEKSAHLRTFAFTKLYFVPQDRVKVHTDKHNWRWVVLDLQICYIGDCEISVELQKLQGTLRIILEPLLVDKPFVGAVTMFFLQKPHLQINWTGLTNLLDALGISNASNGLLEDLIATYLVLPNRVTVPVKKGLDVTSLRFPLPCFIVYEVPGQDLEVDLYDEDPDKDNFLGSLQICLGDVMTNRAVDEWFVLNGTTSRWLHLRLEWLSPITDPDALAKVLDDDQECALGVLELPLCQMLPLHRPHPGAALSAGPLRPGQPHLHEAGAPGNLPLAPRVAGRALAVEQDGLPQHGPPAVCWEETGRKKLGDGFTFFINFGVFSAILSSNIASLVLYSLLLELPLCWTSLSPPCLDLTSPSNFLPICAAC
ncbi:extended synaptotagmin-3-like isoform X2 [Manis javanica]|uniref:extended synaptotagmin-3-like isoform X2 n=1 Tax=Manis javanica TaxID=9974 RepID=UPI003C6D7780